MMIRTLTPMVKPVRVHRFRFAVKDKSIENRIWRQREVAINLAD